jgi:hypothetical protein
MTKPDDIPQDVRRDALSWAVFVGDGTGDAADIIARAIMAEREACAQVAARAYFSGRPFPVTSGEVAAAIRNRGAVT